MMCIMRNSPTPRSQSKEASLQRILAAASARLRKEGLGGAAIASVMQDAGLTHGAFYSHFAGKEDLAVAALQHALVDNRPRWIGRSKDPSWTERLARLGRRYLTPAHRDDLDSGCAFAALASEAGRSDAAFREAYEAELRQSLGAICDDPSGDELFDDAVAFMALCVGGICLARAVADPGLSDLVLVACKAAAPRLARRPTPSRPRRAKARKHER